MPNCDFSSQSVDCLFTTIKYYFPCMTEINVFPKLLSGIDFNGSLKFPILTNLSFTKKRLLRKKFKSKRNFCRQSEPSLSRSDQTDDLFLENSSISESEERQEFLQTISNLSSSLQYCLRKNSWMFLPNPSKNPILRVPRKVINSRAQSALHHSPYLKYWLVNR